MSESGAKSDLPVRAAAGVVMIAVALAAIYYGGLPFRLLVGIAAALMLVEWCDMHKLRRTWPLVSIALVTALLWIVTPSLLPSVQYEGQRAGDAWYGLAVAAGAAVLLAAASRSLTLGWGFLYVAVPAFALLVLNWLSWQAVLWAMVVTWSTDIFAYFAGRAIGGPKLAPRISPNKTWAGLIGGMAGAGVLGALTGVILGIDPLLLFLGAPMGLLAQIGDLYESGVKRRAGVKDSGSLLPGHGGLLDRLDGLLPVVMATLVIVALRTAAA
jgi:phosphatidate cytidylyltransferase